MLPSFNYVKHWICRLYPALTIQQISIQATPYDRSSNFTSNFDSHLIKLWVKVWFTFYQIACKILTHISLNIEWFIISLRFHAIINQSLIHIPSSQSLNQVDFHQITSQSLIHISWNYKVWFAFHQIKNQNLILHFIKSKSDSYVIKSQVRVWFW